MKKPTAVKPTAAGPQSSGSSPSSGGSAEGEEEELDDFLDEEAEDVCEEMETGERVTRTPSMSSMEDVPVSSKDLFEEKFKAFDDEWSQLSTLKIVFNR